MMKMDAGPQKEAPVQWTNLLPVMGDIGFDFPVFLIYTRQAAKDLPDDMGL